MFNTNPTGGGGGSNGVNDQSQQQQPHQSPVNPGATGRQQSSTNSIRKTAFVKITEQPASKALRFRYECEGRSAGSIPGVNSTPENKTFPSIQIIGYKGRAVVVVSCVTKDPPYKPHPHNLVGKEGCRKGVCTVEINSETMSVIFSNLGIQCVKKKDIEEALRVREEIRVDPFRNGFSHRSQPSSIDLNAVRLCFQVFLEGEQRGRFTVPLNPVVSDPIYDKKAMSDLVICKLSDCSCTVAGGKEIIILCEKVAKEDISVRFFEEQDGQIIWEGYGDFQLSNVHKQVAISFRTPKYRALDVVQPVKVYIQLKRPSDGATSEALPFDYLPLDSEPIVLKRKRLERDGHPATHLLLHFQTQDQQQQKQKMMQPSPNLQNPDGMAQQQVGFLSPLGGDSSIKTEPQDHPSPLSYMFPNTSTYRVPQCSPSPQPLSPPSIYYPNNTPSPYSMTAGGSLIPANEQYIPDNVSPTLNINYGSMPSYSQQYQNTAIGNYNQIQQQSQIQQQWNISPSHTKPTFNNICTNFSVENLITNTAESNPQEQEQQRHQQQQQEESLNLNEPIISSNISSLLDMDSQQLTQLNSADLTQLSLSFLDNQNHGGNSISQQLDANIKREEQRRMETEQENMTDSFTKLTTATFNQLADLNNMYNNRNNC